MITLDTNLTLYPSLNYYLPLIKNSNSKAYSAIDQYSDAQAAKGSTATQNTDKTNTANAGTITDPSALIETLKLLIAENIKNPIAIGCIYLKIF